MNQSNVSTGERACECTVVFMYREGVVRGSNSVQIASINVFITLFLHLHFFGKVIIMRACF